MKNILIIFTFFALASGMLLFVFYFEGEMAKLPFSDTSISLSGEIIWEETTPSEETLPEEALMVRNKIDIIKKRLADKWLIIEGDGYYRNQQLPLALKKYLEFYKKNPEDPLIIEKLADTYFEMKKFGSTVNYLQKLKEIPTEKKELFAKSLIASIDLSKAENITSIISTLSTSGFSEEELFYYSTSLKCLSDFHTCKIDFQSYFTAQKVLDIETQTPIKELSFLALKNIETAFLNYQNFKLDDVSLKNAYLIGAWYQDGLYPISIPIGESVLQEKTGYKPVLKIVAQSYFELGKYEEARKTLGIYYEIDSTDASVTYMLGVVNEKLREYILANIYLNKALELWYTPSISVRRQLIHNFYLLENDENMLQAFADMVEEEESIEADDLGLAIYYHILHEKLLQAGIWSKKWQELFSENGDFYAYEGWILREQWKLQEAASVLQKWVTVETNNPFLLINLAYTAQAWGNTGTAIVYFKKVLEVAKDTQWSLQAQKELDAISEIKK